MNLRLMTYVGLLLLAVATLTEAATPQRVLLLQSFGRGVEPYTVFSSALVTELSEISPEPIEFHELSLETALFGGAESEAAFVDYLVSFDSQRPTDLVVTAGGPAATFVQRNRERLFPRTPLLIAGVDERHLSRVSLAASDALAPVRIDLRAPLDSIVRLRPETTRVMVILGTSPLEKFWAEVMHREFEPLEDRLEIEYVHDLPMSEILKRAAALPEGTAIFYGLFVIDSHDVLFEHDRALTELHAVARAPIFGLFEHQLGRGIVGGRLLSVEDAGRKAADAAVRILGGERPSSIRTPAVGPGAPVFDERELARWNIDRELLPPGSEIRFREANVWERYRWRILGVTSLCVLEALLILLLIVNRSRRRRAEDRLRESRERYALAVEGSNEGLWDWKISSDEVFLSPRGRDILGYDERATVAEVWSWDGRVHPGDREHLRAARWCPASRRPSRAARRGTTWNSGWAA